jgi:hypothetical protein
LIDCGQLFSNIHDDKLTNNIAAFGENVYGQKGLPRKASILTTNIANLLHVNGLIREWSVALSKHDPLIYGLF